MSRYEERNAPTLVLTLPEDYRAEFTYRARARTTHGVLVQLLAGARESLILAAPYLGAGALLDDKNLQAALRGALERGVRIDLISTHQSLHGMDLRTVRAAGLGRLQVFQPRANQEVQGVLGSHAKFYVADGKSAYLGSANLTFLGLNQHLELGLLLQDDIAREIMNLWHELRTIGFFVPLES